MSKPIILCVDDERVILDTLTTQLESHLGDLYDYETANSGEEAIELTNSLMNEEQEIALILSDQLMPGLKGDELLVEIHKLSPGTIKILLTGQANADAVGRAVNNANLYRYVSKPWDKTDLMLTVEAATKCYLQSKQIEQQNNILESLFYASTALTKENKLSGVISKLMEIVLDFTLAERGCLILLNEGSTQSINIFKVDSTNKEYGAGIFRIDDDTSLAFSVISHVMEKQKVTVISNCNVQPWRSDSHIQDNKPRSIYCSPIILNDHLKGIFYLENYSRYDAFGKGAIEFMQLFSFEAAISLEKAELYDNLERKVEDRTRELKEQKEIVDEVIKDLTDSIQYASRIQSATMPDINNFQTFFPDSAIYLSPKDVVSGDFYWFHIVDDSIYFAVVDCTGHGVPGAIMSILGNNILSNIVDHHYNLTPAEVLNELHDNLITTLAKNNTEKSLDGMDIALLKYRKKSGQLLFSGANRPIYLVRDGDIIETKAEKFSIGGFTPKGHQFSNQIIDLKIDDMILAFTDGLTDQFGGQENKKITTKKLRSGIIDNHKKSVKDVFEIIITDFNEWKSNIPQTDDVLVVGVRFDKSEFV